MANKYILALDQGTTSSRAILFDKEFNVIGKEQSETSQLFPKPSWVEQDATEIRETQIFVARKLLSRLGIESSDILTTGITNQRETTVIWDKKTGKPVYNAIVWQDKRTSEFCQSIKQKEISNYIKEATGLIVDPYFSATKIKWILENVPGLKQKAINNEILFGTIDTWLIWNLSNGALHISDYSNASRTMLYNINDKCWDKKILDYFDIPENILPQVKNSAEKYGFISEGVLGKNKILLSGIAGDQQAALFGQTCFEQGSVKNTYGTGCFMLMNTGEKAVKSESGLITTIAWGLNGKIVYAIEGSVFIAGAAIQWLRDKLKIIETAQETEKIAYSVKDTAGVYVVPAFAGLGAPYWNMNARGTICGLTGGADYRHIVRASLEAMAFQTKDVLNAMEKDAEISIKNLNVDGGASANNFLLQFQADILNIDVTRPDFIESTALGAAFLAAIGANIYSMDELKSKRKIDKTFIPKMSDKERNFKYNGWIKAIKKSAL
ncbi:MAG: glycerol kinase GlpK [Bacteroidales bacterium]|nr:glycerol kinase GlpK [Bacteroidales bacterium]MDD4150868.1 glycerol kinase GlpK [Bacteroidales bacterium]MDY0141144.1 glycerol kinase GlpK [Bacteroidales bacterium]